MDAEETKSLIEELIGDAISDLKEDLREDFVTRSQVTEILDDEDVMFNESFRDAFDERMQDVRLEI
jgi:hypothetical protein